MEYTKEEEYEIKKDYESGMTPKEIGEKYHRSAKSIDDKLRRMGVRKRGTKIYNFTKGDMDFLKNEYPKRNWDAIFLRFPNVPKNKIYKIMNDNNISMDAYFWSEHDKNILIEKYGAISTKEIQKILDKHYTIRLIQNQAKKMGLTESREWSDDEVEILYKHYEYMTGPEIQKLIPKKSVNAIYIKASQLGLDSSYVHQFYYTDEEKAFILDNWEVMTDEEMADYLGKDRRSVGEHRRKLGLYRDLGYNGYYTIINYLRMNIKEWKKNSMQNCEYKCVLTGKSFDDIHHQHGFNLILQETMEQIDIDDRESIDDYTDAELKQILSTFKSIQDKYPLGVCLCHEVHKLFHQIYGYGNNTVEQWNEFAQNYKNGLYNKHQ